MTLVLTCAGMAGRRASIALVACASGAVLYHAGKRYLFKLDDKGNGRGRSGEVVDPVEFEGSHSPPGKRYSPSGTEFAVVCGPSFVSGLQQPTQLSKYRRRDMIDLPDNLKKFPFLLLTNN